MKSKFDLFILYNPKSNCLATMMWDSACDGVSQWRYTNGDFHWWARGNKHISEMKKTWIVIDRIPESEWRE
jgi:hypothetical protein